jgi:hypothetical protein
MFYANVLGTMAKDEPECEDGSEPGSARRLADLPLAVQGTIWLHVLLGPVRMELDVSGHSGEDLPATPSDLRVPAGGD